jgi:4,5-DOPA dioxygenase extradiol
MKDFPALFVSHGAPDLPLTEHPAKLALQQLGRNLPQPEGIIVVSAHWQTRDVTVGDAREFTTIHDFSGFPEQLYQLRYPAKGSIDLSQQVLAQLNECQIKHEYIIDRGLDHGAWIPLLLLYPQADIPVITISLKSSATPEEHYQLGLALRKLRSSNLILCSGAATHNLGEIRYEGTPPEAWAVAFNNWLTEQIERGDWPSLRDYARQAPNARRAHPSTEHLEPLFVAFGAGGGEPGSCLHQSFSYGNLAMAIYAFGGNIQIYISEKLSAEKH